MESVAAGDRVTVARRETVERAVTPTGTRDAGVDTDNPPPRTETVERSGIVTTMGLAAALHVLTRITGSAPTSTTGFTAP